MMSANSYIILAVGPAFSDILLQLTENQYNFIQERFFPNGRTWIRLDSRYELRSLFNALNIIDPARYMEGGSTILGTLSAMPPYIRNNSIIFTYEGRDNSNISSQSFDIYANTVRELGIKLKVKRVRGTNMVGMVLVSERNHERLLLTHSNYNISFTDDTPVPSAEYLLINGFEMIDTSDNNPIYRLIESRNFKVVLGLGAQNIIYGELKDRIIEYCKNGYIYCLSGNYDEFQELHQCDVNSMRKENIYSLIPYILVTQGSKGMIGYNQNYHYYQEAFDINEQEIKSTSGAGDVALGVFLSGVINGESLPKILSKAAFASSKILRRFSNVFREGIEDVL